MDVDEYEYYQTWISPTYTHDPIVAAACVPLTPTERSLKSVFAFLVTRIQEPHQYNHRGLNPDQSAASQSLFGCNDDVSNHGTGNQGYKSVYGGERLLV